MFVQHNVPHAVDFIPDTGYTVTRIGGIAMPNILNAPKTDTYHFRINPEVRRDVEALYARNGLSFTQAINIFIQQSLNAGGFPFPVTEENAEYARAKALERLTRELEAGKSSGEPVEEAEVYRLLGVEPG